ncbi:response regulator transcription factor [Gilvimarinus algae]|uniref:Response regulator transcription factor n=1 Tax=Gilvimarinus algae TaxID=3058037 RepID=A0ABT8TD38_9GAMM|nr:response regulator transcription factor [Gilvimarinus sp. SDUM040014]MDO3381995.1 response regulator transcription factor [Gilvimarinus sp. SDUM040014]
MKILLAEDQTMLRCALAKLLELEPEFRVTAVSDGGQAQALLREQTFDILLTDIEMPGVSGLELIAWLREHNNPLASVIITTFNRAGFIRRALALDVGGFLLKDAPSDQLVDVIYRVHRGERVIDNDLALQALGDQDPLSDKERRALRLAHEGLSSAQIAQRLCLSEGTIRNYLSEAISKLGAANRVDAARIARQKGWL